MEENDQSTQENNQSRGNYYQDLRGFIDQNVKIEAVIDNEIVIIEGILLSMNFNFPSCVVMTKDKIIFVKNFITMSRDRTDTINQEETYDPFLEQKTTTRLNKKNKGTKQVIVFNE